MHISTFGSIVAKHGIVKGQCRFIEKIIGESSLKRKDGPLADDCTNR